MHPQSVKTNIIQAAVVTKVTSSKLSMVLHIAQCTRKLVSLVTSYVESHLRVRALDIDNTDTSVHAC